MKTITTQELRQKLELEQPAIIEVLGPDKYRDFHLPGALNVPLGDDFDTRIQQAVPAKEREVVVYCLDADCDASPRAAKRMEALGYRNVIDYEAGKKDWRRAGLPVEA